MSDDARSSSTARTSRTRDQGLVDAARRRAKTLTPPPVARAARVPAGASASLLKRMISVTRSRKLPLR